MSPVAIAQSGDEAMESIASGLMYYFKTKPKLTALVVLLIAGCCLYVVMDYVQMMKSSKVSIEKAVPIGEQWSLSSRAYAAQLQPIKINGKLWGYTDPRYQAWVLNQGNAILVWDMQTDEVVRVRFEQNDALKRAK